MADRDVFIQVISIKLPNMGLPSLAHVGSLGSPQLFWHFFAVEQKSSVVPQKPTSLQHTFSGHFSVLPYFPHSDLALQLDKHPVPQKSGPYPQLPHLLQQAPFLHGDVFEHAFVEAIKVEHSTTSRSDVQFIEMNVLNILINHVAIRKVLIEQICFDIAFSH
jgi:hypothetical protein